MNAKHRKTLAAIFRLPTLGTMRWVDIEALFLASGTGISEGAGSRVVIRIAGMRGVFHRPHPQAAACKGAVESVRRMLIQAGVTPQGEDQE